MQKINPPTTWMQATPSFVESASTPSQLCCNSDTEKPQRSEWLGRRGFYRFTYYTRESRIRSFVRTGSKDGCVKGSN